jgi:hypothetical protein
MAAMSEFEADASMKTSTLVGITPEESTVEEVVLDPVVEFEADVVPHAATARPDSTLNATRQKLDARGEGS